MIRKKGPLSNFSTAWPTFYVMYRCLFGGWLLLSTLGANVGPHFMFRAASDCLLAPVRLIRATPWPESYVLSVPLRVELKLSIFFFTGSSL